MKRSEVKLAALTAFREAFPAAIVTSEGDCTVSVSLDHTGWRFNTMTSRSIPHNRLTNDPPCSGMVGHSPSGARTRAVVKKDGSIAFTAAIKSIRQEEEAQIWKKEVEESRLKDIEEKCKFLRESCPDGFHLGRQYSNNFIVEKEGFEGKVKVTVESRAFRVEFNHFCNSEVATYLNVQIRVDEPRLWGAVGLLFETSSKFDAL